jgi:meckelin
MARYFALLLFLCTKLFFLYPVTLFEIDFNTNDSCKDDKKFFQISNLQCGQCDPAKNIIVSDDGFSCTCKAGYKISQYFGGPSVDCIACPSGEVPSEDKWFCLACQTTVNSNGRCDECGENTKAVERELNGTPKSRRECLSCAATPASATVSSPNYAIYPDSAQGFCKVCPSCGVSIPTLTITEITYDNDVKVESDFLVKNFATATTLCLQKQNFTACQLLGNMCVMLDYKQEDDNPCKEYLNMVNNPPLGQGKVQGKQGEENANWPEYMPWLYYRNSHQDAEVELNEEDITIEFETGQSLPFILAAYSANGMFVGYKTDIFGELQMCKDRTTKLDAANKFATLYENSCDLNVSKLWQQQEMYFYDLYFRSSTTNLYAIPLVLENYENNNADSFKSWKLLRRFFLVDNLSGRPKNSDPNADNVIRVAEMIQLNIRLRNGQGQIYPPYIKVRYTTIKLNEDILKRDPTVHVTFQVLYKMDTSSISQDVKVIKEPHDPLYQITAPSSSAPSSSYFHLSFPRLTLFNPPRMVS